MKKKDSGQPESKKLVPQPDFERVFRRVVNVTKEESDRQLAEFQASNKARREERKPKT